MHTPSQFTSKEGLTMLFHQLRITAGILTALVVFMGLFPDPTHAQQASLNPGTYRCRSYNVSGAGGNCATMPPLVLYPDGSYQYSSTRGHWRTHNGTLFLSASTLWGPGKIIGQHSVRFEYDYRGWHHVVTFVCSNCMEQSDAQIESPTPTVTRKSFVGVSLTLEFDSPVSGVSTFTIIPAEVAPGYTHNAPLPEGSVQGLAWEKTRTTVALATNTHNKLETGKRYVIFLSWPSETIPVAILELPHGTADVAATLPATLDGAAVLRDARR